MKGTQFADLQRGQGREHEEESSREEGIDEVAGGSCEQTGRARGDEHLAEPKKRWSARVKRLLFVRNFRRPTGGNVSLRDYFFHALADPRFDTRIWFAPSSRHLDSDLWRHLPHDRVVDAPNWGDTDFVFVNGKDWRLLPPRPYAFRVVHLVQHLGYADDPELREYLARPALRICLSDAACDAIGPHANGPFCVIPSAIDPALFYDGSTRGRGSVLIWGSKSPQLAIAIRERLPQANVDILTDWISREEFAARLRTTDIFVGLTMLREGFYRPALEAMACGCAVVCNDAHGNRAHCIADVTCLQPPHGEADAHAEAVRRLLDDDALAERLREQGRALAQDFTLEVERARLHEAFDSLLA